ncbi:MAG: hypothetical protein JEZ12_27925 [Desulfobacterium sp.]|nr:hypothetical protein [Desulfobacterium sp.]
MGQPAAKQGDQILGTDTHILMIPSPGGPVPIPLPHPFTGQIDDGLSDDVNIEGKPAAVQGSKASNTPSRIPQGELSALGHPRYGSRLHELVGKVNTVTTHNLVRLYILEALQREPRIGKIVNVVVTPAVERPSSVDVSLQVLPVGETQTVTIGPITLELSP